MDIIRLLCVSDDPAFSRSLSAAMAELDGDIAFSMSSGPDESLAALAAPCGLDHDIILLDCRRLPRIPEAAATLGRRPHGACPRIALMSPRDSSDMELSLDMDVDLYLNRGLPLPKLAERLRGRVRTLDSMRKAESFRRRREQRMETLVEMAQTRAGSLSEMADYALQKIIDISGSEMGYLAFVEDDGRTLRMHAWSEGGLARCRIPEKPVLYSMDKVGIWGEPIRQGTDVIVNDFPSPNPLKRGVPEGHVAMERYMAVPIRYEGEVVATAGVANKASPYTEEDAHQVRMLAEGMVSILRGLELRREFMRAQGKYEALLDSLPFSVAVLDQDSRILSVSRLPFHADIRPEDLLGWVVDDMDGPASAPFSRLFRRARDEGVNLREEIAVEIGNERSALLDVSISPVASDGVQSLYIVTVEDVTEARRASLALQRSREKLRLMESVTYHDIANQLMAVKGYLDLLRSQKGRDERDLRLFARMDEAADLIRDQVGALRDYYSLGLSEPQWLDVGKEALRARDGSGLEALDLDCEGLEVLADGVFHKAFHNLFQNSVRHGGPEVRARLSCEELPDGGLRLVYEDRGVGIAPEEKERIFERGYGRGGGLGLFLVREILQACSFQVRERGTNGARFEIDIPPGLHRRVGNPL